MLEGGLQLNGRLIWSESGPSATLFLIRAYAPRRDVGAKGGDVV